MFSYFVLNNVVSSFFQEKNKYCSYSGTNQEFSLTRTQGIRMKMEIKALFGWVWLYTPLIQALGKQRHANLCVFQASQDYRASFRPTNAS